MSLFHTLLLLGVLLVFAWVFPCCSRNQQHTNHQPLPLIVVFPGMGGWLPHVDNSIAGREVVVVEMKGSETMDGGFPATIERCEKLFLEKLAYIRARSTIDTNRITLVGFSLGGDVCFALAQRHPHLVRRVLIMSSRSTYRDSSNFHATGQRFFFIVGDKDPRLSQVQAAKHYVQAMGMESNEAIVPSLGHDVPPTEYICQGLTYLLAEKQDKAR